MKFRDSRSHTEALEVKVKREHTPHDIANVIVNDDVEFAKLKHAMRETGKAMTSLGFQIHFHALAKERVAKIMQKTEQLHVVGADSFPPLSYS
jgi:predicted GNAT superfamily acetyltransferase